MSATREKDLLAGKRKYRDNPENKVQAVKKTFQDKSASIRQYCEENYLKNRKPKITYQKTKYQENPEVQLAYKNIIKK